MLAALLAETRIPFEILFFLIAGAITLIGKLNEKAKKTRQKVIREQQREDARERMALPGVEPDVRQPETLPPAMPDIRRRKSVSAPVVMTPHTHNRGAGAKPARRTRVPVPPLPNVPDAHYQIQTKSAHPAVRRLRANPDALRDAVILREVLGPPVALRGPARPGTWQRR